MNKKTLFLPALLMIFAACTINEPHIPSWDTQWTLVLPTKDFVLSEMVKEDSVISADTTATGIPIFSLSISDSSDWQRITAQDLVLTPDGIAYDEPIGKIELNDPPDITTDSVYVEDFLPSELLEYAETHGDTIPPYPAFDINPPDNEQEFADFRRIDIESGSVRLTFYNRMFLTILPGMVINIYNNSPENGLISRFEFTDSIPSGSTVQSSVADLSGKSITNRIRVEYFVPIAGSDSSMILTSKLRRGAFYTSVSISDLVVTLAEAKVPAQQFSRQDSVDITSEGHLLREAVIERGAIRVTLQNNLPLTSHVDLVLPDFIENDVGKSVHADIPAGRDYNTTIYLNGCSVINHQSPGAYIEDIFYQLSATTDASDDYVTIASSDSVSLDVSIDSLYFSSITGRIDTVKMELDPTEEEGPDFFADFEEGIRLEDLVMTLEFENQIDFPVNMDLQITGERKDGQNIIDSKTIHLDRTIERSSVSPLTTIILDKNSTTPSIVDLLEILPTTIRVSGNGNVGGDGSVQVGQGVRVKYSIESPLSIQLKNPITYEGEIDSLGKDDLDDQAREALTEDVNEAYAKLMLSNGLPVGADVTLYLAVDSTMLYDDIIADSSKKIIINGIVNAGQTNAAGYVETPGDGGITLSLSDSELDIFQSHPLYMRQDVRIHATNGVVRLRQNDEITIQALIKVNYTVNRQDK